MNNEVLCTKCGKSFSARGIRLHELHCKGQLVSSNIEQKAEQNIQPPKSESVSVKEEHQEVQINPEGGADVQTDKQEDQETLSPFLGSIIAFFVLITGSIFLVYMWLKRRGSRDENTEADSETKPREISKELFGPRDTVTVALGK